jgi:hypothetical protein
MSSKRSTPGYYIAVMLLGGLLIAGIALVVAMIARPSVPGASVLAVTDRTPIQCQTPKDGTTCFRTQVTNNGSTQSRFRCDVRPSSSSAVRFVSGTTTTEIQLGVDQSVDLDSIVSSDRSSALAPIVSCQPSSI